MDDNKNITLINNALEKALKEISLKNMIKRSEQDLGLASSFTGNIKPEPIKELISIIDGNREYIIQLLLRVILNLKSEGFFNGK